MLSLLFIAGVGIFLCYLNQLTFFCGCIILISRYCKCKTKKTMINSTFETDITNNKNNDSNKSNVNNEEKKTNKIYKKKKKQTHVTYALVASDDHNEEIKRSSSENYFQNQPNGILELFLCKMKF